MKITKMALNKSALAAMFLMISAYSINVQASVCDAELKNHLETAPSFYINEEQKNVILRQHKDGDVQIFGVLWELEWELEDDGYKLEIDKHEFQIKLMKTSHTQYEDNYYHIPQREYYVCMLKAQRDGKFKSTKQAKNSKTKNSTAESEQSQSANANSQNATNTDTSSNPKPLTKAQLKAQKAEQAAQAAEQDVQQDTQLAQENQAKANQKRQGKRRRHEPENEAHKCISPDFGGLYGGMENTCNFKVWYTYCGYHPTENSWLTGMNCEKQSFGSDEVGPGKQDAAHTKGVEKLFWFACKDPAWPVDVEFVDGDIKGRCHTLRWE
ncbi:MAG: hypothetical protein HOP25_06235 [Methylotenera sp.]|nr:hypothetical protein [Methylotenera sp.]